MIDILLALLGLGVIAALVSPLFDGPDDTTQDPAVDPDNTGNGPITVSEGETVFAGPDDNTITSNGPIGTGTVFASDGNDIIDADLQAGRLNGGAGDDLITADHDSYTLSVYGGLGDDIIISSGLAIRTDVYGGLGADQLRMDFTAVAGDERSSYHGGGGDDQFTAVIDLNVNSSFDSPVPVLTGGAGADMFDLDIRLGTVAVEDPATDDAAAGLIEITDFVAGSDQLQLDADGAAVSLAEAANGAYTDVIVTYPATATSPAVQGIIHLVGVSGLTLDDIILQPPLAA